MGSGKTTYIVSEMNNNPDKRYIYVTPFLSEASRIEDLCRELWFKKPVNTISKSVSFEELVRDGENIAMSHSLFSKSKISKTTLTKIREYGYNLVLDEELEVVEAIKITDHDTKILFNQNLISTNESGMVKWEDDDYNGKFKEIKRMAESNSLYYFDKEKLMWILNTEMLRCFTSITVITYMYKTSMMWEYLDMSGFRHSFYYVSNGILKIGNQSHLEYLAKLKDLIDIYEGHLNKIGGNETALSSTWYKKNKRTGKIKVLTDNAYNYFSRIVRATSSDDCFWCVFKDEMDKGVRSRDADNDTYRRVVPHYVLRELSSNARATNNYKNCHNIAFLCNSYIHPYQLRFFSKNGRKINVEAVVLARLVQWIWRSAIRENEPIKIYIPSSRMRRILRDWLSNEDRLMVQSA